MADLKLVFAILHTSEMTVEKIKTDSPDIPDADAQNLAKVFAMMDGQKAVLLPSWADDNDYSFIALADKSANRELSYQMEQDSFVGCFIDQREEFDTEYDSGDYSQDFSFCFDKKYAEVIPEKEWMALVEAERSGGEANAKD